MPRIGFLNLGQSPGSDESESANPNVEDFLRGLRALGYVEGQNVVVEWRGADGRVERLDALAAELVRLPVDVLVVGGAPSGLAAAAATSTIPIVTLTANPVGAGLAASYARPGGNVTGLDTMRGPLAGKRLELLRDTAPGLARVGVLWTPGLPGREGEYDEVSGPAGALGLELQSLAVRTPADLDGAFAAARAAGTAALLTLDNPLLTSNAGRVAEQALRQRLPSMAANRSYVAAGALMAYGANAAATGHRVAAYVDKLLKGTKAADLPVEQPTTFDFVINLKTAQALGLNIPPSVLLQATEVIQ